MMMINNLFIHFLWLTMACGKPTTTEKPTTDIDAHIRVEIDAGVVKQTIHSFGASDCWSGKFVGQWADDKKKNQVADLLFSTDTLDNGNPIGIGLSLWRFNIGGGSYEQGKESNIADEWRREECFLNEAGEYDWSKQQGQQWFLQAAKSRGVKYTLGFSLTPPVFMTKNGKAYNLPTGTALNIQEGKLEAYADFMTNVTEHFQFDFLSPVNEPQWQWGKEDGASQEGTQAENSEIAALTRLLSHKMKDGNAEIVIAEAGQWDFLYSRNNDGRGDQINQFFSSSSPNFIGDLPQVRKAISGHSYFTTCPDDNMISIRQQIASTVNQVDPALETWQTEFGILGDICDQYSGYPRNTGIDYGLYVAKVLHHDLTIANVTAWHWWLAISPYDYSDALVYINTPDGKMDPLGSKKDGVVLDSKQLWSFGNFARFIRPGMQRIEATIKGMSDPIEAANTLMVSAYKDETEKKLIIVLVNPEDKEKTLVLTDLSASVKLAGDQINVYTTDAHRNLEKSTASGNQIKLNSKSVVTLVATYL